MEIQCQVCMHHCSIEEGQVGRCLARKNVNGTIVANNYGKITSMSLDTIEKKPLYHFSPGSKILSVGSYGCNLNCPFCQNHSISMVKEEEVKVVTIMPEELAEKAYRLKSSGNIGVAFTYNEPLVGFEYVLDASKLVKERAMKTVVITNGCVTEKVAKEIIPYIDALNIDLKGFTTKNYEKLGGNLETVKEFIRLAAARCHIELTTLIVPGENDSAEEMRELAKWVATVGKNIPLHVTKFFPRWKMMDKKATDASKVYELAAVAREYLKYVYEGNC